MGDQDDGGADGDDGGADGDDGDEPAGNTRATGRPSISGTPQVGRTLTAETSGIADSDGLAGSLHLRMGALRRRRNGALTPARRAKAPTALGPPGARWTASGRSG